jgi:hypothetical protein
MSAIKRGLVFATRYFRNLRGGSQPILAEASDGLAYVVKFTNNLQGANLPFNEGIGSELYSAFGLAGPGWRPILVNDSFLDHNPDCWMQTPEGSLRPTAGLCFGSRFLGGNSVRLLEILPGTSFKRVSNRKSFWLAWMIDICARHVDNRQAIFLEDVKGRLKAFFVDHGHLFGGPKGGERQHFLGSRYLDPRIYQDASSLHLLNLQKVARCLDADRLWKQIDGLPDEWKTTSAIEGFAQCLDRLSTTKLLQNVVDTMVDVHDRTHGFERSPSRRGRKAPFGVLCSGVQNTKLEHSMLGGGAGHRACA